MSACLQIGNLRLTGEQIVSALARFNQLESFVGHIWLESALESIALSEAELFAALTGAAPEQKPDQFQDFLARFLEERHISQHDFEGRICRELRLAKLKQVQFDPKVESEFLRRKSEFDQVQFSLLRLQNESFAEELFFQIRDGEAAFGELAARFSEGNERQTQGIVGPVQLAALPDRIAQLFRVSPIQTVLGPLKVGDLYWVMRVEALFEARLTAAVRQQIRDKLFADWLSSQVKAMMADPQKIRLIHSIAVPPIAS